MRNCLRCQTEMIEDAAPVIRGGGNGRLELRGGLGDFSMFETFALKAAVCPNCGEISFYMEDFRNFAKKAKSEA